MLGVDDSVLSYDVVVVMVVAVMQMVLLLVRVARRETHPTSK